MTVLRLLLAILLCLPVAAAETERAGGPAAAPPAATASAPAPAAAAEPASAAPEVGSGSWLMEKYRQGGFTMHIFLVVSLWLVAVLIERLVRLRRAAIIPDGLAEEAEKLWAAGDRDGVKRLGEARPSVLGDMLVFAAEARGASGADLLAGGQDIASRGLRRHLQRLVPLAIITTLGPILGLFGTVVGLIDSFEMMATAGSMGDVRLISGGIATAFICTATGMGVAMPALVGYHLLKLRTNAFALALDQAYAGLVARQVLRAAPAQG